jgi:hypothetical protein
MNSACLLLATQLHQELPMRNEGTGAAGPVTTTSASDKPAASLADKIILAQANTAKATGKPVDDFVLPPPDKVMKVKPIPVGGGIESLAFKLPPNASIDQIKIVEIDGVKMLALVQADGSVIVLEGADGISGSTAQLPNLLLGDIEIPQQALEAAFLNSGIQPAAGPGQAPPSSGGDFAVAEGDIGPYLPISP